MKFEELGLAETLLRAVGAQGYCSPTRIQAAAIPPILEGRDVLGCAQTGTGKTAAFALPMLQRLGRAECRVNGRGRKVRALVLAPTRELSLQISESFRASDAVMLVMIESPLRTVKRTLFRQNCQ
jgi:ATP-dependent RNA helicase RhlE